MEVSCLCAMISRNITIGASPGFGTASAAMYAAFSCGRTKYASALPSAPIHAARTFLSLLLGKYRTLRYNLWRSCNVIDLHLVRCQLLQQPATIRRCQK